MNRTSDAVLMNWGLLKKQLQNHDLILVSSRCKTNGLGRRYDCLGCGGESKHNVMRCKTIWPIRVPEIVSIVWKVEYALRRGKSWGQIYKWDLKKIPSLFVLVMLDCSTKIYSHMNRPWHDWLSPSSSGPNHTNGTTKTLGVLKICKHSSTLPQQLCLYLCWVLTYKVTSVPSLFHLFISSFPPLRVSIATYTVIRVWTNEFHLT